MDSNPILVQLIQFAPVAYAIIRPAILLFVLLSIFLVRPNMGGTMQQQMRGIVYFVLQGVSCALLTIGAMPPVIAVISGQNMQPEWYITFLFAFIGGGLLFVWVDNKIRDLPLESYAYVQTMFRNCIHMIGILSVVLSLISLALATMYEQLQLSGFWAVPVMLLGYGFLLCWLVKERKVAPLKKKSTVKKVLIAKKGSKAKKRA